MDFGSGIQFEGENGTITTTRGGLKFDPISLRRPIAPDDIHLYESKDHFRNLIDAIQNGTQPAAPIETAHRSITISHLANIALRLRRGKLHWDPDTETIQKDPKAQALTSRPMRTPWQH